MKNNENERNALFYEKSPYLLQHAYNPVDWHPWNEKALEKAKLEDKPIFLSIGYASCHWCHVMEKESFKDPEIAEFLNEHFVSIKVDREERPDIDAIYMKACQMMTGEGGWPLSIFLSPDQIPFFAGTYFPPKTLGNRPSFRMVLKQLIEQYHNNREKIDRVTKNVRNALEESTKLESSTGISLGMLMEAYNGLRQDFDEAYGGFGKAPKFPQVHHHLFLLRYSVFHQNKDALDMVERSAHAMYEGGIFDHIGFGFSRYATDNLWLIPHFEKMLYDNALLTILYSELYSATDKIRYKSITEKVVSFLQTDLMENDLFMASIDADTAEGEGDYYTWSIDEVEKVLTNKEAELFLHAYGFSVNGNFKGENLPNLIERKQNEYIQKFKLTDQELENGLAEAREKLKNVRKTRNQPAIDDKFLLGWNALAIVGLAKAGSKLQNKMFVDQAKKSMNKLESTFYKNETWMARYCKGELKYHAYLDDYAYLLWAYVTLYEATLEVNYIIKAENLVTKLMEQFWDQERGGFFYTAIEGEELLIREKEFYDGALPGGNNVIGEVLTRLTYYTNNMEYLKTADKIRVISKAYIKDYPLAATFLLQSLFYVEHPPKQIIVVGERGEEEVEKLVQLSKRKFMPHIQMILITEGDDREAFSSYKRINNLVTFYVCENFTCQSPTTDFEQVLRHIK
ncbi:thioredoxin domain-containing protein [Saliterribacillus persicus]|uniref:Spermatogenesis-associated protein 20-like TRX domain-containing protein n=1 Tax=Saliterribacillus persicus TaxID=930114 RepID=A0A368XZ98_9BACI|nr:thioredoxin domain-containing protein [Saliterribacillus persicus]RCW71867.1 hypothetical protein DFR57_10550 [Saliterribacillus persicus]